MEQILGPKWEGYVLATVAVIVAYWVSAWARRDASGKFTWNPLVITQGVHPRASLSKLQLFFFSLVVLWVVVAFLTWSGKLAALSEDILLLLGIGAAGTAGGKVTAVAKSRISYENWAWIKKKGWIQDSIEREAKGRKPEIQDLLNSRGEFDITKFQLVVFSLVVGVALICFAIRVDLGVELGAHVDEKLKSFEISDQYLGLIGLAQVVYIGGKAIAPNTNGNLDAKLNEVRDLEAKFKNAVAMEWKAAGAGANRTLAGAKVAAPSEYNAFRLKAEEAVTMVVDLTGNTITDAQTEPAIPV